MRFFKSAPMIDREAALPGRTDTTMSVPATHFVLGHPLQGPWPDGYRTAVFATGCFWGTEEIFWKLPGVWSTAAGYAGGFTPNPSYEEVCSGRTGHTEAVLVAYNPDEVTYGDLLRCFWEQHDPTQGMRQGNDVGSQYRSAIYTTDDEQAHEASRSTDVYAAALRDGGLGEVTTEIAPLDHFYYAESYHQQYLAKNPRGYRCHSSTGIAYPG